MAMTPASLAVDRRRRSRWRRPGAGAPPRRRARAVVDAELGQEPGVAEHDAPAVRPCRSTPLPAASRSRVTADSAMLALLAAVDDGARQRMLAGALHARRQAQHLGLGRSPRPGRRATTFGLPSVSVPVLSTTSVSTFSMRSSASAFLISTPACAPRPTPTMIDIGVARPERARAGDDQHRHGRDQRHRQNAAPGPNISPGDEGQRRRRAMTTGTNQPDDLVGQALDRRADALRLRPPSARSATAACRAPTFSARMTKPPVWLSVPPMTLAPDFLGHRHRLAGDHRLVDRRRGLRSPRRRPAPSRRAARAAGRRPRPHRAAPLRRCRPALDPPRGLRRQVEQRADRAARSARGRAAPAPGRAAPAR